MIKEKIDSSIIALSKKLPFQEEIPEPITEAEAKCKQRGGTWDNINKVCIMPKETKEKETKETTEQEKDQVFRDEKGHVAGVTLGEKTYLGLSPQDVERMTAKEQERRGGTTTLSFEEQARQQAQQALQIQQAELGKQALLNLGLTPEQITQIQATAGEAPINWGQAITAGLAQAAPTAVGYGITGALAGGVAGAGIGSTITAPAGGIIGAVSGFVKGMWGGIQSNIKAQQRGEISSTQKVLTNARSNLRQIRMLAQSDPSKADLAVELYNQQIALVYQAQAKLKLETQGNLNSFMDDGTEKLADFDLFLMPGGYADLQRQRLEEALISGVPLSPEQMLIQLQQEQEGLDI